MYRTPVDAGWHPCGHRGTLWGIRGIRGIRAENRATLCGNRGIRGIRAENRATLCSNRGIRGIRGIRTEGNEIIKICIVASSVNFELDGGFGRQA